MQRFADRTLDRKLSAMVSLVSGFTLAFAVVIFAGASIFAAREDLRSRLGVLADAVAVSGRAALSGAGTEAASTTLQSLEAEPQIMSGSLTRADGTVLATYDSRWFKEPEDSREGVFSALLGGMFERHIAVE